MDQLLAIEAVCRKAAVVWVDVGAGPRVVWHVWHDGALWLVCGGLEQDLPGITAPATPGAGRPTPTIPGRADVVVRGPGGDPLRFTADVAAVEPASAEWVSVVPLLHEKRLNPPDGEAQPDRWARESLILRLTPR